MHAVSIAQGSIFSQDSFVSHSLVVSTPAADKTNVGNYHGNDSDINIDDDDEADTAFTTSSGQKLCIET